MGCRDEDAVSSLAGCLAALDRKLTDEDRARIADISDGQTPRLLANRLVQLPLPPVPTKALAELLTPLLCFPRS